MPKRPSKKAMEGAAIANQIWEAEHQGVDSFEEMEEVEEVDDEEEEEEGSSPARVRGGTRAVST